MWLRASKVKLNKLQFRENSLPNHFYFIEQDNVTVDTLIESAPITLSAFVGTLTASVTSNETSQTAQISINNGPYVLSHTVKDGDTIKVRMRSPAVDSVSGSAIATVTVGKGGADIRTSSWIITTHLPGPCPDAFSFTDVSNATASSTITSNEITLSAFLNPVTASVTGGQMRVNGGSLVSSASVSSGDKIKLVVTSGASDGDTASATISIASCSLSTTWTVTTYAPKLVPDQFSFTSSTGDHSTFVESSPVSLLHFSGSLTATVGSNEGIPTIQVSVSHDNGSTWSSYASSQTVSDGDKIKAKMKASSSPSSTVTATISVSTVSANWAVSTLKNVPDAFSFSNTTGCAVSTQTTSGAVTLSSNWEGPSTANVTSDETSQTAAISVSTDSGSTWSSFASSQTVNPGNKIKLHMTSSAINGVTETATVSIGSISETWAVSTASTGHSAPNSFTFTAVTDATRSTEYTSNSSTLSAFDGLITATVSGGSALMSVNSGTFASHASVKSGDSVALKMTSSSSNSTETSATLVIATTTVPWNITTIASAPASFSITATTGAAISTAIESSEIVLTAFEGSYLAHVAGGDSLLRAKNAGIWSSYGNDIDVTSTDVIQIKMTSSSSASTLETATLTVATLSAVWDLTTGIPAATPAAFTIPNISGASPGIIDTGAIILKDDAGSDFIITTGSPLDISVSVSPSTGIVSGWPNINGSPIVTQLTDNNGFFVELDLDNTNSATFSNTYTLTVYAGSPARSSSFTISTREYRTEPAAFSYLTMTDDVGTTEFPASSSQPGQVITPYDASTTPVASNIFFLSNTINMVYDVAGPLPFLIEVCDGSGTPSPGLIPNPIAYIDSIGSTTATAEDAIVIQPTDTVQLTAISPTTAATTVKIKITAGTTVGWWNITTKA